MAAPLAPAGVQSEDVPTARPRRSRKAGKAAADAGDQEGDKWAYLRGAEPPEGPDRWKWFDSPDVWPQVDPDPAWQAELERMTNGLDVSADSVLAQIDLAYWATRERPPW